MSEPNPYAAPQSRPQSRVSGGRFGPIRMALRAVAVVWGFSLLAAPPSHHDPEAGLLFSQPVTKAFGATLLLSAFFPFGEASGKARGVAAATEDL